MESGLSPAGRSALLSAGTQLVRTLEACAAALDRLATEARTQWVAGATTEEIAEVLDVTADFAAALVSEDRTPAVRLRVP
ncbi:hypothetical protein [Raineyella sp. W15-4]|uniref:hypothetical protein n=1 Tax=Raineyella sp. W15-4 TaxID=3081651 RepID=UPI0029550972|nr:hypothetical protein [Raineyella sp. W15-4]WOQ17919.1 hypothetical protein R0145_04190 [Raineyella sp. W15-4]